ncbi:MULTISPECIES: 2OG-Fe(II) oxygenase [Pseudoalteromonas]|uniref:2OG-Fe(II) oxygenase n=1 Tax=Pseudoalteromonas TaxID=53246 RepID=UPI0018914630|nr:MULTISPECIES: 2OG-Fe(II) oxygenase [Pseudoalteromonas]MEC4089178.1 2OG-Fe(II) oxygenase [Pseudoalteromonas rubra]
MWKKLWRWESGRQDSGYDKMLLGGAIWPIKFDCYLIHFPAGSEIKQHVDQVTSGKHYRLNIILKHAKQGGEFICQNTLLNWSRVKLFRPDKEPHAVSRITEGSRYVLSIGWVNT